MHQSQCEIKYIQEQSFYWRLSISRLAIFYIGIEKLNVSQRTLVRGTIAKIIIGLFMTFFDIIVDIRLHFILNSVKMFHTFL